MRQAIIFLRKKLQAQADTEQPRFQIVIDCVYKNYIGDNKWFIVDLEQRKAGDPNHGDYQDEDADIFRKEVREHITAIIATEIDIGKYGAVVTSDEDADGYYVVQWTGLPYTDQETGQLVCDANYLNPVARAQKWYTESVASDTHVLQHVVLGDVNMNIISDTNSLPNTCDKVSAASKGALKVSKESDDFIFEEIYRRDALEDPEFGEP